MIGNNSGFSAVTYAVLKGKSGSGSPGEQEEFNKEVIAKLAELTLADEELDKKIFALVDGALTNAEKTYLLSQTKENENSIEALKNDMTDLKEYIDSQDAEVYNSILSIDEEKIEKLF